MKTISGILCCRNTESLDYCWKEAGQSLLGVCDELVISDCSSSDGTRELIDDWARKDSRIKVVDYPWENPVSTNKWWPEWVNKTIKQASGEWIIQLDADEILHENSYAEVRIASNESRAAICKRWNFWKDDKHLIPSGFCCSDNVIRVGSSKMYMPSDYPMNEALEIMAIAQPAPIFIGHYGFLRKREAFFQKARVVQNIWAGSFDPRLAAAEAAGGNWMTHSGVTGWENNLVPFTGTHPKLILPWLKERGYDC